MPRIITEYTPFQFFFFRIFFSSYLTYFFLVYFPEQLEATQSKPVLYIAAGLAITMGLGFFRRALGFLLFIFWIFECNSLAFHHNPATFMSAFLLLICATTPGPEPAPDFPGIRALPYRLTWFMFIVLVLLDLGTAFHFALDLPAFGIRGEIQYRPPLPWLWTRITASSLFLLFMTYTGTRVLGWMILLVLNFTWMIRFGYHDFSAISLVALVFIFNSRWLTKPADEKLKPIIFFDGYCVLCNRFANYVIREDFAKHFYLAPIQGKTAKETLPREKLINLSSIIYLDSGRTYEKSDAVLHILSEIGGIWTPAKIFFLLPKALRDFVYDVVARNRYNWFGTLNECPLPTPEQRELFKD